MRWSVGEVVIERLTPSAETFGQDHPVVRCPREVRGRWLIASLPIRPSLLIRLLCEPTRFA